MGVLDRLSNEQDKRRQAHALRDEYLRRIDCEAVLDHYGAEHRIEAPNADGTREVIHSCLVDRVDPHHSHGDQNPSARLNLDKKLFVCYAYPEGGGDIFWLIQKMEGAEELHEILPLLSRFLSGTETTPDDFLKELEGIWGPGQREEPMPVFHPKVLDRWALYHPYLRERGVSLEAAEKLRLGYDEVGVRITFPHFVGGNLVGWQRRRLDDPRWPITPPDQYGQRPKYINSVQHPKSRTLYHFDDVPKNGDVIVVESPMSVARAVSLGVENVVATFGAKVSSRQIELLRKFRRVFVWMDDDAPGRAASRKIVSELYLFTDTYEISPDAGMDLGDAPDRAYVEEKVAGAVPAMLSL